VREDSKTKKSLTYVFVSIVMILFIFPFYWTLVSAFKPERNLVLGSITLLPFEFTTSNFIEIFTATDPAKDVTLFLRNSFSVSIMVTVISIAVGILAAYAISDYLFKGRDFLRSSMLLVFLFPPILIASPLMYQLRGVFGWRDSLIGLALINSATVAPIAVWLISSFFENVPEAMRESAALDGASPLKILKDIIIPQSRSGIFAAAAFCFIYSWGDYLFASRFITTNRLSTVPVGLARYLGSQYIEWGGLSAATFITSLVVLIVFFPFVKKFLRGFMAAGTKGS